MPDGKVEAVLGSVGSYDDTDDTVGDMTALDLGVRLGQLNLTVAAKGGDDDGTRADRQAIHAELREEAERRRQEQADGYVDEDDD